jgi:AcrR family transcriptional regulator
MPTGAPIPDVRARLLAAAERVLLRDGPGGLTSRTVTTEAGCAKSVLHRHFGGFDDFLAELTASHAARIRHRAARLLGSTGTGSVAGNLTTALVSLSESADIAVISLAISRDGQRTRRRQASRDPSPLRETEIMIAFYLDQERRLGRVAPADTGMLAFALTASVMLLYAVHDDAPPEPQDICKVVTALLPDCVPSPPR